MLQVKPLQKFAEVYFYAQKRLKLAKLWKIKKLIISGPCKCPKWAVFKASHTDQLKCLIYKEKRTISRPLYNVAGEPGLEPRLTESEATEEKFDDIKQRLFVIYIV